MTALRVYRLEVTSWPTDDGQPWARHYGDNAAAPNHVIPEWLTPLLEDAAPLVGLWNVKTARHRIAARLKYDTDRDRVAGVIMPVVARRHYLAAAGVHELARDMRAFGAEVFVWRSRPVEWEETSHG